MLDRRLIAAAITIVAVLLSELLWPSTATVSRVSLSSAQNTSPDWSAVVGRHRHVRPVPSPESLPVYPAPIALPVSLVTLLREGTNWKISAVAEAAGQSSTWVPLSASTVEVNDGEGYVIVDFAHSASDLPIAGDDDADDAVSSPPTRTAHRGLQSLACEEHGGTTAGSTGAVASSSRGGAGGGGRHAGRRRARVLGATKVTGRCFLVLDDPNDIMGEERTVSFSYEVVPLESAPSTGAAAAMKKKKSKKNKKVISSVSASSEEEEGMTEARVLQGAGGWLQLEKEVDIEAADTATPEDAQASLKVGTVIIREGITRAADAAGGFKATIQLFFFPSESAQGESSVASLFPAGVELSGVNGAFVQAAKQQAEMSKKSSVTSLWSRYVRPCIMAGGVYAVARVLTLVLTKWVDRQQAQTQQASASASVSPAGEHTAPTTAAASKPVSKTGPAASRPPAKRV